jgi:hypothetical protein
VGRRVQVSLAGSWTSGLALRLTARVELFATFAARLKAVPYPIFWILSHPRLHMVRIGTRALRSHFPRRRREMRHAG